MNILHEHMDEEAVIVALELKKVFGIDSTIDDHDLGEAFVQIPEFNGYWDFFGSVSSYLRSREIGQALLLTSRDLYANNENPEDYLFGSFGTVPIVSAARLKGFDGNPTETILVPNQIYMRRILAVAMHEMGHSVIGSLPHYELAYWVNAQTEEKTWLGPHCTDNQCAMYEFVDLKAPKPSEGYLLFGNEKKFDSGLDDQIARIRSDWFCNPCGDEISRWQSGQQA